jgi:hypothetical protein
VQVKSPMAKAVVVQRWASSLAGTQTCGRDTPPPPPHHRQLEVRASLLCQRLEVLVAASSFLNSTRSRGLTTSIHPTMLFFGPLIFSAMPHAGELHQGELMWFWWGNVPRTRPMEETGRSTRDPGRRRLEEKSAYNPPTPIRLAWKNGTGTSSREVTKWSSGSWVKEFFAKLITHRWRK